MARKIVVITGVSKGIGNALAKECQWHGFQVIGISRTEPVHGVDEWIQADLTNPEELTRVASIIKVKYPHINVLINNAGRGLYEKWENTDLDDIRDLFELNFFGLLGFTQKLLPMLKQSRGTVINISSVAGKLPVACMGPYCASKFAVNALSDSLRIEMMPHGVKVLNVMPGRISTGFSDSCTGTQKAPKTPGAKKGPEKLVSAIFKAYEKEKDQLIFPKWYKWVMRAQRFFPNYYAKKNIQKWNLESDK